MASTPTSPTVLRSASPWPSRRRWPREDGIERRVLGFFDRADREVHRDAVSSSAMSASVLAAFASSFARFSSMLRRMVPTCSFQLRCTLAHKPRSCPCPPRRSCATRRPGSGRTPSLLNVLFELGVRDLDFAAATRSSVSLARCKLAQLIRRP
jgi:hypothetical protein